MAPLARTLLLTKSMAVKVANSRKGGSVMLMIVIAFSVDMKLDKISLKMDSDLINTPYLVKLKFLQKQSRYELEHMSRLISSEVDIAVT